MVLALPLSADSDCRAPVDLTLTVISQLGQGSQKCIRFCLIRFFNFSSFSDSDLHFVGFLHFGGLSPIFSIFVKGIGKDMGPRIHDFPDIPRDLGSRAPKKTKKRYLMHSLKPL